MIKIAKEVIQCNKKVIGLYTLNSIFTYFILSYNPFLVQQIVKYVSEYKLESAIVIIAVLICLNFIIDIISLMNRIISIKIQNNISNRFYGLFYAKLNGISILDFDDANFLLKLNQAKMAIESKLEDMLSNIIKVIGILVGLSTTIILISKLNAKYIVLYIVMAILQNFFLYINSTRTLRLIKSQNKKRRIHNYFVDILRNKEMAKEIRLYSDFKWLENKRIKSLKEIEDEHNLYGKRCVKFNFLWAGTMFFGETILYLSMLRDILIGQITIDNVILIIESCTIFIDNIVSLTNCWNVSKENNIYIHELNQILEKDEVNREKIEKSKNYMVSLRNVFFNYNNESILKEINLDLKKNEILVLVGENGSGKTTLSKIIAGLYTPKQGDVIYSSNDISAIFQDYAKYKLSLRINIGIGNTKKIDNDDDISSALSLVRMKNILKRIDGNLDVELTKEFHENGIDLSLGEWQKIAFARGLIKEAEIIIFDEPTSSLDPLSEIYEFSLIKEKMKNKTIILVTHRLGLINLAQRIVFMKAGRIVEIGTHDELINKRGEYYKFYSTQAKWYK